MTNTRPAGRASAVAPARNEQRLLVDWLRCDGHRLCAEIVPELVRLDDWGYPVVTGPVTPVLEAQARRAVALCPALALRLERGA
jgi:ferredoxin